MALLHCFPELLIKPSANPANRIAVYQATLCYMVVVSPYLLVFQSEFLRQLGERAVRVQLQFANNSQVREIKLCFLRRFV